MSETKPSVWFFAEWISIIATFLVCFVFLFYQNQAQSARSDHLHELYVEAQKEIKQVYIDILKERKG